jgi:hypothetical protein
MKPPGKGSPGLRDWERGSGVFTAGRQTDYAVDVGLLQARHPAPSSTTALAVRLAARVAELEDANARLVRENAWLYDLVGLI